MLLGEWCELPTETLSGRAGPRDGWTLELWGDLLDEGYRRAVVTVLRHRKLDSDARIVAVEERDAAHGQDDRALLLEAAGRRLDGAADLVVRLADGRPCFAAKLTPLTAGAGERLADLVEELERLRASGELERQATEFLDARRRAPAVRPGLALLRREERALVDRLAPGLDLRSAPALATPAELRFLLRRASRRGDARSVSVAIRALEAVAQSSLVDHIAGGFFARIRASESSPRTRLDELAGYARAFVEGFQLTREPRYRRLAREALDAALDRLAAPEGGYFAGSAPESSQAYAFDRAMLRRLVAEDAELVAHFYQLPLEASAEGRLPTSRIPLEEVARRAGLPESRVLEGLTRARLLLAEHRHALPRCIDERVFVGENAGFAETLLAAYAVFGDGRHRDAAEDLLAFLDERSRETPAAGWMRDEPFGSLGAGDAARLDSAFRALGACTDSALQGQRTTSLRELVRPAPLESLDLRELPPLARALQKKADHEASLVDEEAAVRTLTVAFSRPIPHAFEEERALLLLELESALHPSLGVRLRVGSDAGGAPLASALRELYLGPDGPKWETTAGESAVLITLDDEERIVVDPERVGPTIVELQRRRPPRTFVDSRRVPGRATRASTLAYLDARGVSPERRAFLGELAVARVGLGTRALGLESPEHRQLALAAVTRGQNAIDVSPAFAGGDAERLVGDVLGSGDVERASLVLLGRLGLFVGTEAERLASGKFEARVLPLAPGVPTSSACRTLDAELLRLSLEASLERMNVETLDVGFLPWPEEVAPDERSRLFEEAFDALAEDERRGRLGTLGFALPSLEDAATALAEIRRLAARHPKLVGRVPILALPLTVGDVLPPELVDAARERTVALVALRPLTDLSRGFLHRLVERDESGEDSSEERFREARYRVASLEAEFETRFAPLLRAQRKLGSKAALELGGVLGATLDRTESLEQFLLAEATLVTPHLTRRLADLSILLAPLHEAGWPAFQSDYVARAAEFLAVLRARAAAKSRALTAEVRARHAPLRSPNGRELRYPEAAVASLLEGSVAVAILGQRLVAHVDDWCAFLVEPTDAPSSAR